MSHTKLLSHIIFRTKRSKMTIHPEHAKDLYRYIWGVVKNMNCILLQINGMPEHLHQFVQYPATLAVSDLVRTIKANSSQWAKKSGYFPLFEGWASEYAAFTYSAHDQQMIINYIKNQQAHHQQVSFRDEVLRLYREFGMEDRCDFFFADP